uniref:Putative methyltransferase n=2 Tax=viral metagenome TaxID=1070528 RepID=A0A6M3XXU9_9ZZZZ
MLSVLFGEQDTIFKNILEFYVPAPAKILDLTWGAGKLWQSVDERMSRYDIIKLDVNKLETRPSIYCDIRNLPLAGTFKGIIYDPPYKYDARSFTFLSRPDYDWKPSKSLWTLQAQINTAKSLNEQLPFLMDEDSRLIIKIMDTRVKGRMILNHKMLIDLFTNFELVDLLIYIRLGVGVFRNPRTAQVAHGYYLVFRKKLNKLLDVYASS